jgi:hypothetical protein
MMPPPIVNQTRDMPNEQPTISLSLLHQVGGVPGAPGAGPSFRGMSQSSISRLRLIAKQIDGSPNSDRYIRKTCVVSRHAFGQGLKEGD